MQLETTGNASTVRRWKIEDCLPTMVRFYRPFGDWSGAGRAIISDAASARPPRVCAVLRVQGRQRSVVKMGGECSIADKSNVSLLALTNAATVTLILPVGPK